MRGCHANCVQLKLDHFFVWFGIKMLLKKTIQSPRTEWNARSLRNLPGKLPQRAHVAHLWEGWHHCVVPCVFQGTTGSPKGATLSHRNIVNNANLIGLRLGITEQVGLRRNAVWGGRRDHVHGERWCLLSRRAGCFATNDTEGCACVTFFISLMFRFSFM